MLLQWAQAASGLQKYYFYKSSKFVQKTLIANKPNRIVVAKMNISPNIRIIIWAPAHTHTYIHTHTNTYIQTHVALGMGAFASSVKIFKQYMWLYFRKPTVLSHFIFREIQILNIECIVPLLWLITVAPGILHK